MGEFEKMVLEIAKKSIEEWVRNKNLWEPELSALEKEFSIPKGVFVTIYKKTSQGKELRGCIGFPYPLYPLGRAVARAAKEACEDPRFPPLSEEELKEIKIEVSILSEPKKLEVKNRAKLPEMLDKSKGYIIKRGFNSGLFLPQVWKELSDPEEFLANLCFKAGLPPDSWLDPKTEIYEFEAKIICEKYESSK